jgi:hypothetical protein
VFVQGSEAGSFQRCRACSALIDCNLFELMRGFKLRRVQGLLTTNSLARSKKCFFFFMPSSSFV